MRRRVQVLVAGLLVAFAAALSGCVAQTADDGDEVVDQAAAELVTGTSAEVPDDGTGVTRASTGVNNATTSSVSKPDGSDVMGEPIPVPWTPTPLTQSDQSPNQTGKR